MDDFFKSPDKSIAHYEDTRPRSLYRKPYYKEDDPRKPDAETRKYFFTNKTEYKHCKALTTALNRNLIMVS